MPATSKHYNEPILMALVLFVLWLLLVVSPRWETVDARSTQVVTTVQSIVLLVYVPLAYYLCSPHWLARLRKNAR
jgi:hypothetical protein